MLIVPQKTRAAYVQCFQSSQDHDGVLSAWGSMISAEWVAVNANVGQGTGGSHGGAPMSSAHSTGGKALEEMVKVVSALSNSMETLIPVVN